MKTSKPAFAPFNAPTRKKINAVMEDLGLYLISTPKQIANGTLMYRDPDADCIYSFHESGYCRRAILGGLGSSFRYRDQYYVSYQLNKTRWGAKTTNYYGSEYTSWQKIRILANPMEQLGIVSAAVVRYRKGHNSKPHQQ